MTIDNSELYNKVKAELQSVEWEALKPHLDRDAIILCSLPHDIARVGVYLATDNVDAIKDLMATGDLVKVSQEDTEDWEADSKFLFLIVQPFVLIQALQ